ncbi:hypothetical protein D3C79_1008980 [compost metagenome]
MERTLAGVELHAIAIQLSAIDLRLDEAHATGLGGFEQLDYHAVRVDEMPGTGEKQAAQDRRGQLWRSGVHRVG